MEGVSSQVYCPSMASRPAVVLSPHLDDAVLSCWHLLGGSGEVSVINVFAGSPAPGSGAYWWDRESGATDSAVRMAERRVEDREAFSIAGRTATNLDFLEEQYEPPDQSVEVITARLRELIDPGAVVYAPAALGDHRDHERVRSVGLALAAGGQQVCLYADHPHAVRLGWPRWVNGFGHRPGPDVAAQWDQRLREAGLALPRPNLHHLSADDRRRKLAAVSAYRSQIRALESAFGSIEGFPAFPYEFVWDLR